MLISCDKEENPDAVSELLFECYNPKVDGLIIPELYEGIPLKCTKFYFDEEFSDNKKNWTTKSDDWISYKIQNGFYDIKTKDKFSYNFNVFLDDNTVPVKNYQIEIKVKLSQTSVNSRVFGITFNGNSWVYNFFGFNSDKIVFGSNSSQNSSVVSLNSKNNTNVNDFRIITVRNFEGITYMFLDKLLVFQSNSNNTSAELGYIVPQNSDVLFDYIKVIKWNKF